MTTTPLRSTSRLAAACALWCLLGLSCGSSSQGSGFTPDSGGGGGHDATVDGGRDAAAAFTLEVTPAKSSAQVAIGKAGQSVSFKALRRNGGGASSVDVTKDVTWSIVDSAIAASAGGGVFTLQGIGGQTQVGATLDGVSGNAALTVLATGNAYFGGTSSASQASFASATPDTNPADAPGVQYPLSGVVLPGNIPPIDFQWSQAADNDLYRVHLTSPSILDVELYTSALDLVADAATWAAIGKTAPDLAITMTVEATGPSKQLRTSASETLTISADTIDNSAIYAWQTSTATFHVLDMTKGTDVVLPNNAPLLAPGQQCSGCHRISRDGTRFSFTYTGSFEFGALAYDAKSGTFLQKIAPTTSFIGTYATFNPLESSEVAAMLVTQPDTVPQNTAGTVRLELRDPDTNVVVPSNLASMLAALGTPDPGQATSMPDWSADGSFVVFTAYDSSINFVRDLGDDMVLGSIVEAPVSFKSGSFTFGTPKVLVAAHSSDDPDTGENNLLPAISPDGIAVAFTRAAGWWSIKTQASLINLSGQIVMVRRSDGQIIELVQGSNGAGTTLSSTWPQWAPTPGGRYAWLAYGSERPYGHLLTPTNKNCGALVQGQGSCKQLWVMAIDLTKMKSGTADPSFSPFWIPGQSINAQYVSPQWTQAVLPPPK